VPPGDRQERQTDRFPRRPVDEKTAACTGNGGVSGKSSERPGKAAESTGGDHERPVDSHESPSRDNERPGTFISRHLSGVFPCAILIARSLFRLKEELGK